VGQSTVAEDHRNSATVYLRNVCIFAEGEVDRSPTGTGVSGLLALAHAKAWISKEKPTLHVQR
jgi:trans-L-3-hydroxyproline dehydratase